MCLQATTKQCDQKDIARLQCQHMLPSSEAYEQVCPPGAAVNGALTATVDAVADNERALHQATRSYQGRIC